MRGFGYQDDIVTRYPRVVGGVIHARDVRNPASSPDLAAAFAEEQQAVRQRIGSTPLSELPSLAAWRRVFRDFGVDPTQYRSAAEALLRRLVKQGELPGISTLVDLANLVSIRHALPVAVFDLRTIDGAISVGFATGTSPGRTWAPASPRIRIRARSSSSTPRAPSTLDAGAGASRPRAPPGRARARSS